MNGGTKARVGERFAREQIVVDLGHRSIVTSLITEGSPFHVQQSQSLPELGLALLSVPDLDGTAVSRLPGSETLVEELSAERARLGLPGGPSDLDLLLVHLRRTAAARYAGWVPLMGKNRDVEAVGGLPHIGGGERLPERVEPAAVALPVRPPAGARPVHVAVLDTGLFPVAALEGRCRTTDYTEAQPPFWPWHGHAAFVVGRILQRAPGAEIHVHRVLRDENGRASSWDVAKGMGSFLGSGVEILNMSLGFSTADGSSGLVMERAVDVLSAEMIIVAAAGNHGDRGDELDPPPLDELDDFPDLASVPTKAGSPTWPAALPNVVAVGATDAHGEPAPFNPRGVPWLDLLAPGVDVLSTYLTGEVQAARPTIEGSTLTFPKPSKVDDFRGTARWSGNSFAAADVTGEIARLAQESGLAPRQALRSILARRPDGGHDIHPPRR
jgi:membrane-anchored mycosin MYCP